ncbi:hypothetical protein DEO72_LG2g2138 [Vigna unguiculata]|uniref:Uncharacterized protein n=1 Tax=Vigna unguiculata TaxID=3917 RepID=A0A4D6KVN8_VIGUN|nr:hypothetical protein DEO72_LG2g2138 [Vigna unguiculata]
MVKEACRPPLLRTSHDATEPGKVAAHKGGEGDCGVDVATENVCADRDGDDEGEGVGNGDGEESGGRVDGEGFYGGVGGSEDEDECRDERVTEARGIRRGFAKLKP